MTVTYTVVSRVQQRSHWMNLEVLKWTATVYTTLTHAYFLYSTAHFNFN